MDALIGRHLQPNEIESVTPLLGGDLNECVLVTLVDGDLLVARRRLRAESLWGPTIEGQVTALRLAGACGVDVPEVVASDDTGMIYRYVPGEVIGPGVRLGSVDGRNGPDRDGPETPEVAAAAGRIYGRLHALHGEGLGPVQPDGSAAGWSADAYYRVAAAEQLLARTPPPIAAKVVERAAEIMVSRAPIPRSRFVHGDASPANTLVGADGVMALIDFEAAAWADPAIDLAWWWYDSPHTADDFARGCAEISEPTDQETIWVYRFRLLLSLAEAIADIDPAQLSRIGRMLAQGVAFFR